MSSSLKRAPRTRPTSPPQPTKEPRPPEATAATPDVPIERPYQGDTYGLWIWIVCALILVALHITDPVYYWLRK